MGETPGISKQQQRMMRTMARARKSAAHSETWQVAYEAGFVEASKLAVEIAQRNGLDPQTFYQDMTGLIRE